MWRGSGGRSKGVQSNQSVVPIRRRQNLSITGKKCQAAGPCLANIVGRFGRSGRRHQEGSDDSLSEGKRQQSLPTMFDCLTTTPCNLILRGGLGSKFAFLATTVLYKIVPRILLRNNLSLTTKKS